MTTSADSPVIDTTSGGANTDFAAQMFGLIQPQKQISLDIGLQSNYTDLPDIRGDVYTISIVANLNAIFSSIPVPHQWNYEDGIGGSSSFEVDQWDNSSAPITSAAASLLVRNEFFNVSNDTQGYITGQFWDTTLAPPAFVPRCHNEMNISHVKDPLVQAPIGNHVTATDYLGVILEDHTDGSRIPASSNPNLYNEYATTDGLLNSTVPNYVTQGTNQTDLGCLVGQVQEALIHWFESANYTEGSAPGTTVDPRKFDILRFWVDRGSDPTLQHLAKMKKDSVKNLIAQTHEPIVGAPKEIDPSKTATLQHCCFDADQIKQLFSTVEFTGRVKVAGTGIPVDSSTGNPSAVAAVTLAAPRHVLDLKHGEGFAIVVPATAKLRSSTTTTANLLVRVFQEY